MVISQPADSRIRDAAGPKSNLPLTTTVAQKYIIPTNPLKPGGLYRPDFPLPIAVTETWESD